MDALFEPDIEQQLRLPWEMICRLAVKAHISKMSLNDIVESAIKEYIKTVK